MKKTETGYGILNGLLILFIAIDTFFIFPIYEGIGSSIVVSIVLSILITGILDSASYVASSWGLARLFVIPRINQFQIKKDRLIAIIIFVVVLGLTIGIQTFLVIQQYGQISGVIYGGNRVLDYISIMVPIITTLLSFVLGLIPFLTGKIKYDRFENEETLTVIKEHYKAREEKGEENYEKT